MTIAKGTALTYIGHTDACKEDCGWPCCPPGESCPWEERIGKKLTVIENQPGCNLKVEFEGEPDSYFFIRFRAHVSQERSKP